MTAPEGFKRTRLTPESRRSQILDEVAKLVINDGLSSFSMEAVARQCRISKALIYNYFPNRDLLLGALLQRAQNELRDRGMRTALQAKSFPELIRQTTRLYLEHTQERGALIQALLSDPSVARMMEDENRKDRDQTIRYFVKEARHAYGLSLPIAIAAVDMLMAVTDQAGKQCASGDLDIDTAEDMCVWLITAGMERLSERASARDPK